MCVKIAAEEKNWAGTMDQVVQIFMEKWVDNDLKNHNKRVEIRKIVLFFFREKYKNGAKTQK